MHNPLKTIHYAYQRISRGYDDRIFWAIDDYFEQFVPAIQKFLVKQLQVVEDTDNIYQHTLDLLLHWKALEAKYAEQTDVTDNSIELLKEIHQAKYEFWSYFGNHIGHYWI